ncbi:SIS domain-containing protein [Microlunatus flavus]|uniref:Tagatose-6-phosphate ketose/aldose isomerase n=1 Tax=Microlunatus flavus TaxID=1036181 RepID=A0A1H9MH80_9ACTN|nr:SIS domain-containing protein [Microlunatus flavus]SER22879.1 tagatose-6-phosphate ketose/aldose isomerase [Microlunatus flavus]
MTTATTSASAAHDAGLGGSPAGLEAIDPSGSATAREIAQQPRVWRELGDLLTGVGAEVDAFLGPLLARPDLRIVLTGAGSSAFAGELLAPALALATRHRVEAVATTTIVSGPAAVFAEDVPTLLVSFARSGDSPESVAAVRLADAQLGAVWHLLVSCNAEGELAQTFAGDERALVLPLPPATHDAGFAMTSSFTSMVLACWFALTGVDAAPAALDRLAGEAERLLTAAPDVAALAESRPGRVVYLGSGPLTGMARESALKLLELTAGDVLAYHESPLGFRHGPKALLTDDTLVVVLRSTDAYTSRYDDDIVAELRRELDPQQVVVLGADAAAGGGASAGWSWSTEGLDDLGDALAAVVFAVFAQMFALRSSVARGLTPDNPFPSGEVNRVVQGVVLHPYPA